MAELDVARFYDRLGNLHSHFAKHRCVRHRRYCLLLQWQSNSLTPFLPTNRSGPIWGDASCLCLLRGKLNENEPYLKSVVLHHYLFGYELPDTILLLTHEGHCYILTAKKKCEFLETAVGKAPPGSPILGLTHFSK
jgi:FACT complex subunit SPT16 N-terminal lobe domain